MATNCTVRKVCIQAVQIALLGSFSWTGHAVVALLHIPLPGNVLGLLLTLAALQCGLLRLSHVEAGGALLLRHLSLLFIPLAAGIGRFDALIASHGLTILLTLSASAAIGFVVTGWVSQVNFGARGARPSSSTHHV